MGLGVVCVGEESQADVEECSATGVVLVVLAQALLLISEPGEDAVMVPRERGRSMAPGNALGALRREP